MDLYFSPLACSMATRIALYEAGADANYHRGRSARPRSCRTTARTFSPVNPLGLVPTLRTDDGACSPRTPRSCNMSPTASRRPASRADRGHRAQPAAAMALLHRHRAAQGPVRAAARQKAPPEMKAYALAEGPVAARLSRELSRRAANSCSTISASPTPISSR